MPLSKTSAEDFLSYLSSLGMLEINVSLLYRAIAEKTVDSNAKRHLLKISKDSAEHSKLLKGVANFVKIPDQISKPNQGKKAEAMERTDKLRTKVQALSRISGIEFSELFEELVSLQNSLSEEYMNLTEVSLPLALEGMISGMSSDEEQHQKILVTVKFIVSPDKAERENTPVVKYTNPDNWRR
jgi:hypothetical protein